MVAAVKRDYYEVLGVPRDADEEEIRRAFQAQARDWHPDVAEGPEAEERFRELAEAYSVLSRREARALYDRYGYRGRGNQGVEDGSDSARGEDVHAELELQSFEAEEGTRRLISFHVVARCTACMGHGYLGQPDPECEYCLGTGRKRTVSNVDSAQMLELQPCPACIRELCAQCGGRGRVDAERRLRLRIPPGIVEGTQLRVAGDGNDGGAGSVPGDLLVRVHVLPPPRDPRLVRYLALVLLIVAAATLVLYLVH